MAHAARAMTALEIPGKLESAYAAPQTGDRGVGAARTERERDADGPRVAASSARAVCACLVLTAWGILRVNMYVQRRADRRAPGTPSACAR